MPLYSNNFGTILAQSTQPSSASTGTVWIDTAYNPARIKIYDGTNWDIVNVFTSTAAPSSPGAGELWFDTSLTVPKLKVYNSTLATWVPVNTQDTSTTFPTRFPLNRNFYHTVAGDYYENTGTMDTPAWTKRFVSDLDYYEGFDWYASQTAADTAWPSSDTAKARVNVSNDNLDFDGVFDASNDNIVFDLQDSDALGTGVNASDTAWVLRFKLRWSTLTASANSTLYMGLSDSTNTAGMTTSQDFIGLQILFTTTTKGYGTSDSNNEALNVTPDNTQSYTWLTSTDYYVEIKRLTATTYRGQVFTGSDFTTGSLGQMAGTTVAGVASLRYIKICNAMVTEAGQMTGTIDDVQFYNGVTSATQA